MCHCSTEPPSSSDANAAAAKVNDSLNSFVHLTSNQLWIGKDYTNFIARDFTDLHEPFAGRLYEFEFVQKF